MNQYVRASSLLLPVLATLLLLNCSQINAAGSVMPWMCLERCGANATTIAAHIDDLRRHRAVIDSVSFEWLDLGPQGSVIDNNFTDVAPTLNTFAKTFGMITTVNLTYIRQCIFNKSAATSFLVQVANRAVAKNLTGINFDWEPNDASGSAGTNDAIAYANFLLLARQIMTSISATRPIVVSADVAEWTAILSNWTAVSAAMSAAISNAPLGAVIPMSTYTYDNDLFISRLQKAVKEIDVNVLRVGLMTWTDNNPPVMNRTEIEFRFGALAYANICRIAIWVVPIPDIWWKPLSDFKARCSETK